MSNALITPRNSDSPAGVAVALKIDNPQSDGLPIWGPSNAGVTYIWRCRLRQQTGYYTTFWWGNNGSFLWDGGNPNTYYGAGPYPQSGGSAGTAHYWEIAIDGGDVTTTLAGGPKVVVKGQWFTQGLRVTYNGDNTKTLRYYTDLPSTANADVIETTVSAAYGNTNPPSPVLYLFDAPWSVGNERQSDAFKDFKIFASDIGQADMVSESGNFHALATSAGQSSIWYGKKGGFLTVDSLTCDYGTGRSFAWVDAGNKGTLLTNGSAGGWFKA